MDSDATMLQNALAALREHYGDRLDGPRRRTEAQLRGTLQERLGLDELSADRVVKKLREVGMIAYRGVLETGQEPGTTTTGPVISLPGAYAAGSEPIITTAAPGVVMSGVTPDPQRPDALEQGQAQNLVGPEKGLLGDLTAAEAPRPLTRGEYEELGDDPTDGYWHLG